MPDPLHDCTSAVPELSARGVIRQVFPLHEQRILSQLMKSWVQAVCEKQPLGWPKKTQDTFCHTHRHKQKKAMRHIAIQILIVFLLRNVTKKCILLESVSCFPPDDICDYFGVKIAMYFAWLGFYTTSMLYPAVIGFVLWMLTESDQVRRTGAAGETRFTSSSRGASEASALLASVLVADEPRHLLRGVCTLQRGVGHTLPGAVEEEGS